MLITGVSAEIRLLDWSYVEWCVSTTQVSEIDGTVNALVETADISDKRKLRR